VSFRLLSATEFGTRGSEVQILSPRPIISKAVEGLQHLSRKVLRRLFLGCAQFCAHPGVPRLPGRSPLTDEHISLKWPRNYGPLYALVSMRHSQTRPAASKKYVADCKARMGALPRAAEPSCVVFFSLSDQHDQCGWVLAISSLPRAVLSLPTDLAGVL
jgi:hypothetical protein